MDDEYEAIRAKRLAELQQQQGDVNKISPEDRQKLQKEREEKEEEMRHSILSHVLSQEARARLNTIKAAKPEKAKMVEDILINNARMGHIGGQVCSSFPSRFTRCPRMI
ncbi:programmed cell death 5 isoform X2 [Brevipalpus obovatus]|uniref:programmed cell death 5 isoform X2 n=1 Tax=Brevipalpus obovatus TaxID=246614 RepID=UPI003D9F7ECE